jgi:peroxiredoxin
MIRIRGASTWFGNARTTGELFAHLNLANLVEEALYGRTYWGVERTTLVIGPGGLIAHVFRKIKPAEHDAKVLGVLGA